MNINLLKALIPSKSELKAIPRKLFILQKNLFHYKYPFMFTRIEIDIYNLCNRKCSYCPNSIYKTKPHKMKEKLFYKIIDQLGEIGYRNEITLHRYGEPLLDNRLEKFVKYICKKCKGATINLHTNGVLLDYAAFKKLSEAGVKIFTITQHDMCLSQNNLSIFNNATREERKKIVFRMGAELYKINRGGLLSLREEKRENRPCYEPRRNFTIDSYGKVLLCCNDYLSKIVLGDLTKEKIMDIWKNKKYNHLRSELAKGNRGITPICRCCDW